MTKTIPTIAAALLMTAVATPVFAQAAIQERMCLDCPGEHLPYFGEERRVAIARPLDERLACGRRLIERRLEDSTDATKIVRRDCAQRCRVVRHKCRASLAGRSETVPHCI